MPENTELPALPSMNEIHRRVLQVLTGDPGNAPRGLDARGAMGENRQALKPARDTVPAP